jgi:hypothetical protein
MNILLTEGPAVNLRIAIEDMLGERRTPVVEGRYANETLFNRMLGGDSATSSMSRCKML